MTRLMASAASLTSISFPGTPVLAELGLEQRGLMAQRVVVQIDRFRKELAQELVSQFNVDLC